jgi:membrane protein
MAEERSEPGGIEGLIRRVDRFQKERHWLAFPYAVVKKFGDDRGGNLAALIAYYGFFSLFPLLLALFTLIALFLGPDSELGRQIQDSALAQFPVIGDDIRNNIATISGTGLTLAIGLVGALWGGLGVTQAAQTAMNEVWDVPRRERPNFIQSKLRGFLMLVLLGSLVIASTLLAAFGTAGGSFIPFKLLGLAGSFALNLGVYMIAFRVLTDRELTWGQVFPGAAVAAVLWGLAQILGGYLVNRQVQGASDTYGFFAIVIGLLAWIYLGATISLYGAEVNVVRINRLWPRSLQEKPPLTSADERTLTRAAEAEEKIPEQNVQVSFDRTAARPEPRGGEEGAGARPESPRQPVEPAPSADREAEPSTSDRAAAVAGGLQALVGKQVELARREIGEAVGARLKGAGALAAAGLVGLLVLLFLGQAATTALDGVLPTWAARLVVGAVVVVMLAVAAGIGMRWMRRPGLAPRRALQTTRANLRWARTLLGGDHKRRPRARTGSRSTG